MSEVTQDRLDALAERLLHVESYLHVDKSRELVAQLEKQSAEPDFWNDQEVAKDVMSRLAQAREAVSGMERAKDALADAEAAFELGNETQDQELIGEAAALCDNLDKSLTELELSSWFEDDLDHGDAILTLTPGQGGQDAQGFCELLYKMYLAYAERRGWSVTVNDATPGEPIGLDRATFTIAGHNAYGMLRAEKGIHRMVRISPTDTKHRRQTSFCSVEVLPVLPDDIEVDIDPGDLRIDVYHASGHGGQGVNTTDSAVRITHLPTGIVVTCQNERSQLQNKAFAMKILRGRLYELEQERRENELDELRGPKRDIGMGNQIRSYVLYPYQMVKDLRSGVETGNVDAVMKEGDLDPFIVGYHRWHVGEHREAVGS